MSKRYQKEIMRTLLILSTLSVMLFIFANSAKDSVQSSAQSDSVIDAVRPPAEVILPAVGIEPSQSNLVTIVRTLGHFLEFALLGCFAFWTVRSWKLKPWLYAVLPFVFCVSTALADETVQLTSPGRAWQLQDVFVDAAGAACGMLFAFLCVLTCVLVKKRRKKL